MIGDDNDITPAPPEMPGHLARPELTADSVVAGRYRLAAPLAGGGMSRVFVGEDLRLGRRVALKFLDAARFSGRADGNVARRRFSREARVVASLVHPHIVGVFDVGEDLGVPFIVMQLLDGETLGARIRDQRIPPIDQALRTMREMSSALAFAHARGVLHRDLKPDNVMISSGGAASLLDFGLARVLEQAGDSVSGMVVGTPAYLAPEVLHDEPYTIQSDIFSAGITFFEYVTGRYPFSRGSMFYSIAFEEAPSPSRLRPDLPVAMEALLLRMLAKRPRDRYQSFDEIGHDLERIASHPLEARELAADEGFLAWQAGAERTQLELPFVGRDRELLEVDHGFARAGAGMGAAFAVVGDAGMGKSRLAHELTRRARLRQFDVYMGRAVETRGEHPYQPFVTLLRHWADRHALRTAEDLARLIREKHPRLAGVQDVLGDLLGLAPGGVHGRDRVWGAIAQLFACFADARAALVVMEDLHHADPATLNLLGFVLHELRRLRLVVVFTCRPESEAAARLLASLSAAGLASTLSLGPLRPADVSSMVERLVVGGVDTRALVEFLAREAQGSPLFLVELMKLLKADGILVPRGQGYELAREPSMTRIPEGMRSVIGRRLLRLASEEREIADVAAVAGASFSADDLQGIVRSDRLTVLRHLQALERLHHLIVAEGRNQWRFAHERIRSLLYEEISTPLRIEYHGLLADRLGRRGIATDAPRLARHYDAAGRSAEASRWHVVAGEQARKTAAFEVAAGHFERALELAVTGSTAHLRLDLGDAYLEQARLEAAEEVIEQARREGEASGDRRVQIRAWEALGQIAERRGDAGRLLACAERGLALLAGSEDRDFEAALLGLQGMGRLLAGDRAGARATYQQALAVARAGGDSRRQSWALYRLATTDLDGGDLDAAERWLNEAEALARPAGDLGLLVRSIQARGWIQRGRGLLADHLALQRQALAEAEHSAGPNLRSAIRLNTADAHLLLGELEPAREQLTATVEFARSTTARRLHFTALMNLVDVCREQGDLAAALDAAHAADGLAGAVEPALRHMLALNRGVLEGELGQSERAVARLSAERRGSAGAPPGGAELYLGLIQAESDPVAAAALLREAAQFLADPALIVHRAVAQAALARVLAVLGEPNGAAAVLDTLPAAALESQTADRERHLALAAVARASGDLARQLEHLERAGVLARGQGAKLRLAEIQIERGAALAARASDGPAESALEEAASIVAAVARALPGEAQAGFLSRNTFQAIRDRLGAPATGGTHAM